MAENTAPPVEELTEDERRALRMGALAWSAGRGNEEALYGACLAVVVDRLAQVLPRRVCATCKTEWTADVAACPTPERHPSSLSPGTDAQLEAHETAHESGDVRVEVAV